MNRRRKLLTQLLSCAGAVLLGSIALAAVACGDDDGGGATATPAATTPAVTPTPPSGPGTITVGSSGAIEGQANTVLLVFAAPEEGGDLLGRVCIQIDSDRFSVPSTVMTELPAGDDPCSGSTAEATLDEGTYTLSAGIYAPPAQTAAAETTQAVRVSGDVTVQIDGAALSR